MKPNDLVNYYLDRAEEAAEESGFDEDLVLEYVRLAIAAFQKSSDDLIITQLPSLNLH